MNKPSLEFLLLVNDLARMLRTEADRRARAFGMTRAQWATLRRVSHQPGLSQREMAELVEVEPITIARLVDRLEARGLVERRPDQADRRIWRLHLQPAAAAVLAELDVQAAEIELLLTSGLEAGLLTQAATVLRRMKRNVVACGRATAARDPDLETA